MEPPRAPRWFRAAPWPVQRLPWPWTQARATVHHCVWGPHHRPTPPASVWSNQHPRGLRVSTKILLNHSFTTGDLRSTLLPLVPLRPHAPPWGATFWWTLLLPDASNRSSIAPSCSSAPPYPPPLPLPLRWPLSDFTGTATPAPWGQLPCFGCGLPTHGGSQPTRMG
jgi:hypothetical protein